jgi:Xaa-Pro dipeptidase
MHMNGAARIDALRQEMAQAGLDALVVTRTGGVAYLAGVLVPWRTAIVVTPDADPELITVRNDIFRVLDQTWIQSHRTWEMANPDGFAEVVVDALKAKGLERGRIGVDLVTAAHPGALSAAEYLVWKDALPDAELVNGIAVLDRIMIIKDHSEIEALRRAAEMADLGMEAAFDAIAPGVTDLHVAGVAEAAMRSAGSEFVWSVTGTEVGSGYRQRYEAGFTVAASDKRIQRGDIVTVDVHPMYRCYLGDLALNAVVGEPTPEQLRLEAAWKAVADSIFAELRPGAVISDISRIAREVSESDEYGRHTIPFFGHGLGTDARIPPIISEANDAKLEKDMVFEVLVQTTVPHIGGLRLETAVHITDDGFEHLNKCPVELRVLDAEKPLKF